MDVPSREEHEARLARVTSRTLRQQFNNIMDALGDEPSPAGLTPQLYEDMHAALMAAIRPVLEAVYMAQVEGLTHEAIPSVKQGGIGVDWGLINQRAADWASQYTFELVTGIVNTSRNTLQKQVGDFFTDQRTISDLRQSLEPLFGPVRAEMIAETEITRASSAGEQAFADELEALGLEVTQIWETNNDEIARRCPICWPRHKKRRGDGWTELPPAHPRCRCFVNTVVVAVRSVDFPALVAQKASTGYKGMFVKVA